MGQTLSEGFSAEEPIAFVSHESARIACWNLAGQEVERWPAGSSRQFLPSGCCVTGQRQFGRLAATANLHGIGLDAGPVELLVPTASSRSRGRRANLHVWCDAILPGSFLVAERRLLVSSPCFTVLQLGCARRPTRITQERARREMEAERELRARLGMPEQGFSMTDLLEWENIWRLVCLARTVTEFAGTYLPAVPPSVQVTFGHPPLATRDEMRAYLAGLLPSSAGIMRARRAVELGFDRSASPMETALALMLSLDVDLGGFGLPRPTLNHPIDVDPLRRDLASQNRMELDLAWDEVRLTAEYDGDDHHPVEDAEKAAEDNERQNSLVTMGHAVLRVRYPQVVNYSRLALLARQIAHILDVELVQPTDLQMIRRRKLHAALLVPLVQRYGV